MHILYSPFQRFYLVLLKSVLPTEQTFFDRAGTPSRRLIRDVSRIVQLDFFSFLFIWNSFKLRQDFDLLLGLLAELISRVETDFLNLLNKKKV